MQFTAVLLLACTLAISARINSQTITLSGKDLPMERVFTAIEKQTGYLLLTNKEIFNKADRISIGVKKMELIPFLELILKGKPYEFEIKGKNIFIRKKRKIPDLRQGSSMVLVELPPIKIQVVDSLGQSLPGITVSLKKSRVLGVTDAEGVFIASVNVGDVLVFSSVGFQTVERMVSDNSLLVIGLRPAVAKLEEVKVVYNTGYEKINKERSAGSFVQIDNELFNRRVGATVLDRLDDIVPGMLRSKRTADHLSNYTIRGIATINASTSPLLVVDNFIFDGDPSTLNPNDIESVTVLKDATAASIWGVRAGNGVIVLTTKKGRMNRSPNISLVSNINILERPNLYAIPSVPSKDIVSIERDRFNRGYYDLFLNDNVSYMVLPLAVEIMAMAKNGQISQFEVNEQLGILSNHDIRDDINKYLLQDGISQQYALNISGGTTTHQYYGSMGYDRSRSNDVNSYNERLSLRFNNTWKPIERLALGGEINWTNSDEYSANSMQNFMTILNNPYGRLADELGNPLSIPYDIREVYKNNVEFPGKLDWRYIPLNERENGNFRNVSNDLRINGSINYKLIEGLIADIRYQWQTALGESKDIAGVDTYRTRDMINRFVTVGSNGLPVYPYPLGAIYTHSKYNQSAWNFRAQLNLDKSFKSHRINSSLGFESREVKTEGQQMPTQFGYNQETNTFQIVQYGDWPSRPEGFDLTLLPLIAALRGDLKRFSSVFMNWGYTFNSRYIISASGRVDQSNFFGVKANARKAPLWSIGTGWNISNEKFYNLSWLPYLKLKATYGFSGNTNAGTTPLATVEYRTPSPSNPIQVPFATIATPPNPQLMWEKVKTINLALDFGSHERRINGSIEIYRKFGLNLISAIPVGPSSGFSNYTGNNASIEGNGIDLSINSLNINSYFQWRTSFILGYNKEKVTSYAIPLPSGFLSPSGYSTQSRPIIGKPLSKLYSYRWAGLNPISGDAQFYANAQIVGSKNQANAQFGDYIYNGRMIPASFGSLRNDFRWKRISLSINLSYGLGHFFRRKSFEGSLGEAYGISSWQHRDYLKAWRHPGDEVFTNVPGFLDSYADNRYSIYAYSDILIEKGDFIRLQDIKFDYDFGQLGIRRLPVKNFNLYIYVNNLGFLWKSSKYNPDTQGGLSYPLQKSFAIGLNIQF